MEVFNLDSPNSTCKYPPPFTGTYIIAGLGYSNELFLCFVDFCSNYDNGEWKMNSWKILNNPNLFSPSAFNPDQSGAGRMILTGGQARPRQVKYLTPNGWVGSNDKLPFDMFFGCVVSINSTTFLIIGGPVDESVTRSSKKVVFYNVASDTFTEGPERKERRETDQCVKIRSSKTHISIAGGFDATTALPRYYLQTTEYLDIETGGWNWGPPLPFGITMGSMVEHPKGGALLIGGSDQNQKILDTFFYLPSITGNWVKLPQKLQVPRYRHVNLLIPDYVTSCS